MRSDEDSTLLIANNTICAYPTPSRISGLRLTFERAAQDIFLFR
jgi:hypothetical protein